MEQCIVDLLPRTREDGTVYFDVATDADFEPILNRMISKFGSVIRLDRPGFSTFANLQEFAFQTEIIETKNLDAMYKVEKAFDLKLAEKNG